MRSRGLPMAFGLLMLLHGYIGWRLIPAAAGVGAGMAGQVAGGVLLLILLLLVPAGLLSRGVQPAALADRLAWAGFLAMGLFSSLLLFTFGRDLLLGTVAVVGLSGPVLRERSAQTVPLLALAVSAIGLVNARRVARVVEVRVPIAGLPAALEGFSIVQLSDLHVGPTIKRGYLQAIVDRVNGLGADLIAITGDLVDGSVKQLAPHTAPLAQLQARHGAFFVTGNHEYYAGAPSWIAEVARLGLTVLSNEHVVLTHRGARLLLGGVTDYTAHHFDASQKSDAKAAIAGAPPEVAVKILLAHQPRSAEGAAEAGFDLQLSGHTHGGQFFPWNLFVPLQQPFVAGLHRLRDLWVYTSRGTGYWGPPKRFGAPSEITRLRLVAA